MSQVLNIRHFRPLFASVIRATKPFSRPYLLQTQAAASSTPPPTFHLLQYSYVPDILEKRTPYRADHLAAAQKQADAGHLLMAGALAEPVDGAVFIFKNVTKDAVESYVKSDPYFKAGLITKYSVRPYMVAVGGQ